MKQAVGSDKITVDLQYELDSGVVDALAILSPFR
jgi:hypothetical protein